MAKSNFSDGVWTSDPVVVKYCHLQVHLDKKSWFHMNIYDRNIWVENWGATFPIRFFIFLDYH